MPINSFIKDPDEVLDYGMNWSNWLATGESITSSIWLTTANATLATSNASHTTSVAIVWLSSGVVNTIYTVTNRIGTSGSRIADRSISVKVRAK